jgi:hypothetical protein
MRWTRQRRARKSDRRAGLSCERSAGAQDERRFNAFAEASADGYKARRSLWRRRATPSPDLRSAAHGRSKRLAEVAAYGEVVWSWHPLLMLSPRRCVGPTGLRQIVIREATVTKRNSSPGRARRKPLKPLRGESRIASAGPVCSCALCSVHYAHETAGAARTRLSLRPLFSEEGETNRITRANHAARMRMCILTPPSCPRRQASSTPRLIRSTTAASSILDRPPSRTMTKERLFET